MKGCCTCVGWKIMPFTESEGEGLCKKKGGKRTAYSFICPKYREDFIFIRWARRVNKRKQNKEVYDGRKNQG